MLNNNVPFFLHKTNSEQQVKIQELQDKLSKVHFIPDSLTR